MNQVVVDQRILERFKRVVKSGRLAHAYLFVGPKETGKTQTALSVAQLVNCDSDVDQPCGRCVACQKIASANHPDVVIVDLEKDEAVIKIEQIRHLIERLQLRAYEARTKVLIIRNAENMTTQAANSLLKTLEEPALNTLMLLTTSTPEANLDTIRSRCHVVKFFPASLGHLQQALGTSAETARFLTGYTDGCMGQSRHLLDNDFMVHKSEIIAGFFTASNEDFLKKITKDKEDSKEALHIFLSIVRDAILLKSGVAADELMNVDQLRQIQGLARHSFEELSAILTQVIKTKELLDENLNAKMAFSILRQRIWLN